MRTRTLALVAALVVVGACSAGPATEEPSGTVAPAASDGPTLPAEDGAGDFPRTVEVPAGPDLAATSLILDAAPRRVAALTYETAELVAELGAADRLVMVQQAMTNPALSDHAEAMADVAHHAPTEGDIDVEAVIAARPELVLLSDRRGLEAGVGRAIEGAGIPVLVLPNTWASVEDLALNIGLVGQALGLDEAAAELADEITDGLGDVTDPAGPRVLVLSNQAGQPFVTAGAAFPLEVVRLAGAQDGSESLGMARSGPISAEQVIAADPDAILLVDLHGSGEQVFTPLLTNPAVAALPAVAEDRVLLVEGREVQALGLTSTVEGRDRIADWLAAHDVAASPS